MSHLIRFALVWTAIAAGVTYVFGWWWYRRWGSAQPRSMTPRDAGLPENIIPPRSRWEFLHERVPRGVYLSVRRRSRADAIHNTSAPYIVKWRSWRCDVVAFTHHIHISRWSERWAS